MNDIENNYFYPPAWKLCPYSRKSLGSVTPTEPFPATWWKQRSWAICSCGSDFFCGCGSLVFILRQCTFAALFLEISALLEHNNTCVSQLTWTITSAMQHPHALFPSEAGQPADVLITPPHGAHSQNSKDEGTQQTHFCWFYNLKTFEIILSHVFLLFPYITLPPYFSLSLSLSFFS